MNIVTVSEQLPDPLIPPVGVVKETLSQKKIAQLSAPHYGWCPYNDIELMGPLGLERHVAYNEKGEFATRLLRGQLLPFINVEIRQLSQKDNNIPNGPKPVLEDIVKYAGTCASELEDSYGDWGFMILTPLTGLSVEEAFSIFSVVQPAVYDLAALEDQLTIEAPQRIAEASAADPTFRDSDAEILRRMMVIGAQRAATHAGYVVETLRQDMADRQGGGHGRSYASPGDVHAFRQLRQPVPSRLSVAKTQTDDDIRALIKALAEKQLSGDVPNAQEAQFAMALELMKKSEERQARLEEEIRQMREAEALRTGTTAQ